MKSPSGIQGRTIPKWTAALGALGLIASPAIVTAQTQLEGLPDQVVASFSPTVISGYVDVSTVWRIFDSPHAGAEKSFPNTYRSPGRLYDGPSKQDRLNLDAFSLALEKPVTDDGWAAGYRAQMLAGDDFQLRNAHALSGGAGEVGLHEAYVVLRAPYGNGVDTRVGYFTSPLGYEVYDSYLNPNFSRSYGYYITPKAHTGVTVRYPWAEWIDTMAGIANNYSPYIDAKADSESGKTYLGVVTLNGAWFGHRDMSLKIGYTGGNTAIDAPTDSSPRVHNFSAAFRSPLPVKGLSIGVAYDYRANFGANEPKVFFLPAGPESTYANAAALYLDYKIDKWTFDARFEYASGSAGDTIFGSRGAFGSSKPMTGPNDEQFLGITTTIGYSLFENVLTRVEFRWDKDLAGGTPVFGSSSEPRHNSFTIGFNAVYTF